MSSLFGKLRKEASSAGLEPRSRESMEWFRKKAYNIRRVDRMSLMKSEEVQLRNQTAIGKMYHWFYQPKHRATLPYYDSFPLGIIVGPAKDGFYGLNLHYLPPLLRAHFLDKLIDISNNKTFNENTKLKVTYDLLKASNKYAEFKPCFKHYLNDHVRSKFALIPASEWEIAIFLPSADWQKAKSHEVYRQSKRMI